METETIQPKNKNKKHDHESENCTCNKDCMNCKVEQVIDIEKINSEIEKLKPQTI
jgi:hypothetical protein